MKEANANDLVDQVGQWECSNNQNQLNSHLQMIGELLEDRKIASVALRDQTIRRKFRIGPLRPRLDLRLTNPVVSGLDSLTRTSDAVMEYSEVDELPNFNVKFNAKVSNIKTKVAAKGTVSEIHL